MHGPAITPEAAIRYLLDRQLLDDRDVVEGDVRVEEVWGRNENLRVVSSGGRSYFLKRARPGDASGAAAIAAEAALVARLHDATRDWPVRPAVPGFVDYDPERALLILELVTGARTADEFDAAHTRFGVPPIGALLGAALAACHATLQGSTDLSSLDSTPPFVLEVARPEPEVLQEISPGQIDLLTLVQERPGVCAALDEMYRAWPATTLIHGDIKWSNVLVSPVASSGRPAAVWLVDWEFASLGDPAWDVGSAFHGFLLDCVHEAAYAENADPAGAAVAFASAVPAAQHEVRALWAAYARSNTAPGTVADALLERAVGYSAARLLQSAYEWSSGEARMPRIAVGALQLSLNMFSRSARARRSLLGMP